jgi:hypothetical protein
VCRPQAKGTEWRKSGGANEAVNPTLQTRFLRSWERGSASVFRHLWEEVNYPRLRSENNRLLMGGTGTEGSGHTVQLFLNHVPPGVTML